MPAPDFTIGQGDTASAIASTLRDADGVAVDIDGATITFVLTPVAGGAAKVNAGAANDQVGDGSDGSKGQVHYQWVAGDTDTPGFYLGSWVVEFAGGAEQTYPNEGYLLVHVSPDAPTSLGQDYITLEQAKGSAELVGQSYLDADLALAITAASRGIDRACGQRFYADADASQVRYYTPDSVSRLNVDPLVTLTELATDDNADGTFAYVWTLNSDFVLEPLNAAADGKPYDRIRVLPQGRYWFACSRPRYVRVTGKFGWAAVPEGVRAATSIIAARLVKRTREAPFGLVALGIDGATIRASNLATDSDLAFLLADYTREQPRLR